MRVDAVSSWARAEQVVDSGGVPALAPTIWWLIGNTGGDGVSHRDDCADDARRSDGGGWLDDTQVEALAHGVGRCVGWLWVQADGVSSWVRGTYLVEFAASAAVGPEALRIIGNTGGRGVAHRIDCADGARLVGGWLDGTEVEVLGQGVGRCVGWLMVSADGVTSWLREECALKAPELPSAGTGGS